jgi:hypothetical protein
MNATLTKNSSAPSRGKTLLPILIAMLALVGGAQMIAAAPAGAWLAECDEEVSCTGDGGGGGPATGNGGGGGQDGSGGDQGALDPCYVDPGPNCWGSTDSGNQGQGSSGSSNSNSGGSSGTASDDLCASWGVSCGTAQSGGGNGNGGFGAPDPTLPVAARDPETPSVSDLLHTLRMDCAVDTHGVPLTGTIRQACKEIQNEIPSQKDCGALRLQFKRSGLPRGSAEGGWKWAEWSLCEAEVDFVAVKNQCTYSYLSGELAGYPLPFDDPAQTRQCELDIRDVTNELVRRMLARNRAKERRDQLEQRLAPSGNSSN